MSTTRWLVMVALGAVGGVVVGCLGGCLLLYLSGGLPAEVFAPAQGIDAPAKAVAETPMPVSFPTGTVPTSTPHPTSTPYPTYTSVLGSTPLPAPTPYPTYTTVPTYTPVIIVATPTMRPMPRVFVEISGSGDLVTENYDWGHCGKVVFYWTGRPLGDGGNLFVDLCKVGEERCVSVVTETIYAPVEGQKLQPLSGGVYYFAIYGPEVSWTIRGECQD